MNEKNTRAKGAFAVICTVQFICILILIAGTVAVKYISPEKYKKISAFFEHEMCEETSADDVMRYFKDAV